MVEDMLKKTKCLCSLIDSSMVEEVFEFLEIYRIDRLLHRAELNIFRFL